MVFQKKTQNEILCDFERYAFKGSETEGRAFLGAGAEEGAVPKISVFRVLL